MRSPIIPFIGWFSWEQLKYNPRSILKARNISFWVHSGSCCQWWHRRRKKNHTRGCPESKSTVMHFLGADIMTPQIKETVWEMLTDLQKYFPSFSLYTHVICTPPNGLIPVLDSFTTVLLPALSSFPLPLLFPWYPRESVVDLRAQETINLIMGSLPLYFFFPLSVHIHSLSTSPLCLSLSFTS